MLIVRDMLPSDLNLVRDSFVKTVKKLPIVASVDSELLRMLPTMALANGWDLRCLVDDSEPGEVMAWMVCLIRSRNVLWACRKPRYKGMGLGHRLLEMVFPTRGDLYCAFVNPRATGILLPKGYNVHLRPYLAMEIMSYE
jgi:hypothetical protein